MRKATSTERLECLAVLGSILPDHRVCTWCNGLHIVDSKDVPKRGYNTCCETYTVPKSSWYRILMLASYAIEFHHVQLAVKYTLRNIHQDYREEILQRYTASCSNCFPTTVDFTVEPVIVQGRFIMMTTYLFGNVVKPLSVTTFTSILFHFCPHLSVHTGALHTAIKLAFNVAGSQRSLPPMVYSCNRCPTDYSVIVQQNRVTIYVLQDYGSGTFPTDPYWQSHNPVQNDVYCGTFIYKHGSIRDSYYGNGIVL